GGPLRARRGRVGAGDPAHERDLDVCRCGRRARGFGGAAGLRVARGLRDAVEPGGYREGFDGRRQQRRQRRRRGGRLMGRRAVRRRERGVVLVLVLWVFMTLGVLALDFSSYMRDDATATLNLSDETRGYYMALAGLNR